MARPEPATALRTVVYTRRRRAVDEPVIDATSRNEAAIDDADAGPRRSALSIAAVGVPPVVFAWFGWTAHPELAIGVPIVFGLGLVALHLTRNLNRRRSFDLAGIVLTGFAMKLVFVALRYDAIYGTYSGVGDAGAYHEHGVRLAQAYRMLDFAEPARQKIPGTGFIRVVTGYVYAVLTPDIVIGFIVFGLFAFIGTFLLYRAFELAVPEGNARRYALLIFLWPSMLFWPGSIGKEAWILLGMGLFAYGGARVLSHQRGGFLLAAAGAWAIVMTRPHVILLLFGAFAVGYALRPGSRVAGLGLATKIVGGLFLFAVGTFMISTFNEFFGIDEFSQESIEQEFEETSEQTSQGGSRYETPSPFSPLGYPIALVTVLFRPFPFEADNAQMLLTSVEGLVLAVLLLSAVPRMLSAPGALRKWPYVAASLTYVPVFAFAFSSLGNFGILARQRVQMLPFLFVLVALPPLGSAVADRRRARRRPRETVSVHR
ncbi:MAG: hypothetical protein U5K30_02005 [Acidimicrobiales bacterium]|nr:hypothetical protein [Acidimicrobiales bacterium]